MALNFKRILCPVDLSRFSRYALRLAANLAESSNASLYILHVVQNPFDELYMTPITQADPGATKLYQRESSKRAELLDAATRHSEVLLKQFCHDQVDRLPKTRYLVETGDPFEKILDLAKTRRIDLIVLATHGRTGIKRLIIGNVAEKVVRHASCPVLTVKGRVRSSH